MAHSWKWEHKARCGRQLSLMRRGHGPFLELQQARDVPLQEIQAVGTRRQVTIPCGGIGARPFMDRRRGEEPPRRCNNQEESGDRQLSPLEA